LIGEFDRLTDAIVGKKNAPQRKAQAALNSWLDSNGGPVFNNAKIRVARLRDAIAKRDRLIAEAAAWDAAPLLCLEPQEACLKEWGFLDSTGAITQMGLAATEVNEGHGILMPIMAFSDKAAILTGEEIACVLAAFLNESRVENPPTLASSGLRREVLDILHWSHDTATACQRTEATNRVLEPSESFWALSSLWVCITARWVAGAGLTELATEFELFEGNIQRGLMRIANLLEEWGAVATLRCDLPTLEKLSGLRFLRDEVIVDSLYLRL
jgi:superfamily II RNA helicase